MISERAERSQTGLSNTGPRQAGPDDPYVLDARRHLGNALRELGEYPLAYQTIESTMA